MYKCVAMIRQRVKSKGSATCTASQTIGLYHCCSDIELILRLLYSSTHE